MCINIIEDPEMGKKMGCKTWKKEAVDYWATIFLSFCGVFCSKMLKREYLIIYHNYYNLPVAGPCLQTPNWGLKTRQQISSSSWLQEVSRSQAVPGSGQPAAPSCFLHTSHILQLQLHLGSPHSANRAKQGSSVLSWGAVGKMGPMVCRWTN